MTHSMLNKSLVENVNLETGLELVIHEVANQKGPTPQRSSVVYELKPGKKLAMSWRVCVMFYTTVKRICR